MDLRRKLESRGPRLIQTVRGRGYGLLKSREAEVAEAQSESSADAAKGGPSEQAPAPHMEVG